MNTALDSRPETRQESRRRKIHPFARTTYPGRIIILGVGTLMVASLVWERSPGLAIAAIVVGNLHPHLMYLIARFSGQSRKVGQITFFLDAVLLAGFIGRAIPPRAGGVPYVKER